MGTLQVHVETPLIPPIKGRNDEKPEKYCVKVKLSRYPTPQKSDLYELKMALFDNDYPEELLLLIMNLKASGMLVAGAKIQYLLILVRGEVLRQFEIFSAERGSTTS